MLFKFAQSRRSFEECLSPHLSYLYRVALRLTGNNEDAEDLVQDLVLKVHSAKTDLQTLENPKPWLTKVLYRLFVDNYRQKQRVSLISIDDADYDQESRPETESLNNSSTPEHFLEQYHFMKSIEEALRSIKEDQRLLIIMYEIEGFSISEISQTLDLPAGTIKSRLHRARIKLRQILEKSGTDWSPDSCSMTKTAQKRTK